MIFSCLLLMVLSLSTFQFLVEGNYKVEVQVLSYSNPTNTCGGSGCQCNRTLLHDRACRCCDVAGGTSSNCDEDINSCDNIFTYCLRRTLLSLSNCDGSERMTTRTNWNGAPLNFKNETVLGLPNPFILEGLDSQWMGTVLHISVKDNDPRSMTDDLVDTFTIPIVSSVQVGQESIPSVHHGDFNIARIELNLSILCADNFFGPFCNVTCPPNNQDCPTCLPGYTGNFCQIEIDDCEGVDCSGHGQCVDEIRAFTCICDQGYTGDICDTIDHCHDNQCRHGNCSNLQTAFECACDPGFSGFLCDIIDHCANSNCSSNSHCTNSNETFLCQCVSGYTGQSCDINIDDCLGVVCPENHECVDGLDSYECLHANNTEAASAESLHGSILGGIIGGIVGGTTLLLISFIAVVIMAVLNRRFKRSANISGKTVMMAGDNPVYILSSDIIPISVLPSQNHGKSRNYVNVSTLTHSDIYDKLAKADGANIITDQPDSEGDTMKKESHTLRSKLELGNGHKRYENVVLEVSAENESGMTSPTNRRESEQNGAQSYENVSL